MKEALEIRIEDGDDNLGLVESLGAEPTCHRISDIITTLGSASSEYTEQLRQLSGPDGRCSASFTTQDGNSRLDITNDEGGRYYLTISQSQEGIGTLTISIVDVGAGHEDVVQTMALGDEARKKVSESIADLSFHSAAGSIMLATEKSDMYTTETLSKQLATELPDFIDTYRNSEHISESLVFINHFEDDNEFIVELPSACLAITYRTCQLDNPWPRQRNTPAGAQEQEPITPSRIVVGKLDGSTKIIPGIELVVNHLPTIGVEGVDDEFYDAFLQFNSNNTITPIEEPVQTRLALINVLSELRTLEESRKMLELYDEIINDVDDED